jgi:hypothetical protein
MVASRRKDFLSFPLANFRTRFVFGVNGFQVIRLDMHLRRTSGVGYDHRWGGCRDSSGI